MVAEALQSRRREVRRGQVIFAEGEPGDSAYLIDAGRVRLTTLIDGQPMTIADVGKGELIGEMALIDDGLRSATATALDNVALVVISRDYVRQRIDRGDDLMRLLLKVVLQRYREMRERLELLMRGELPATGSRATERAYEQDARQAADRLQAEAELQRALERDELELYYQPIIDLQRQRIAGCEALVRWNHPERGLVPPDEFIPLAEETRLIQPMGLWIAETACRMQARVGQPAGLYMSINLSGRQFESPLLLDDLSRLFGQSALATGLLKLEITESLLMHNPAQVERVLCELRELGPRIAIDDFGTGYSSFSYLHRFPIDALKIDRSFVSSMGDNAKSLAIVRSLCDLARSLGMQVIAEGVETAEEARQLTAFGAEFGQGYFYSRPLPADRFEQFVGDGLVV